MLDAAHASVCATPTLTRRLILSLLFLPPVAMSSLLDSIKSSAVGQAVSHLLDTKQLQHDAATDGQPLDLSDEAAVGRFQEFLRIPTMTIEGATSQPSHHN